MINETIRDCVDVLYSDSEAMSANSESLKSICLLTEKSVAVVRNDLNNVLETKHDAPNEIEYAVLRSKALEALDVLNALNFMFEIVENSARNLYSLSEEIASAATIICDANAAQKGDAS